MSPEITEVRFDIRRYFQKTRTFTLTEDGVFRDTEGSLVSLR